MGLLDLQHSGPSVGFFDRRYVNVTGDTMTGSLLNKERIAVGSGITVVNPNFTIEANEIFTDTSGEKRGLSFFVGSNPGTLSSTSLLGFNGFVEHQSSSNVTGALFGGFAGSRLASTATASVMYGGFWEVQSTSTGTASFAVGNVGSINESGGGTIGFSYGLQSTATVAGSIGTFYGVQVSNPSGAGTMSTNYGIHIDNQTKGATNQAIYLEGTGSTNAVEWQGDTRLYRGFAGGVYTDGSFVLPQDNGYVYMGASFDFGLTHDGTNCLIDAFTGNLELDSSSGSVYLAPTAATPVTVGTATADTGSKLTVNGYATFEQSHAEMYTYESGVTVTATLANTYYTITGITAGLSSGAGYAVVDATNGTLTIGANGAGIYEIGFFVSLSANKVVELHGSVFVNGTDTQKIAWRRDISTANQIGSASATGLYELSSGDVITFRLESSSASTTVSIDHAQLFVRRISR